MIVDPYWDKLSHTRVINLVGAATGSILMFWLTLTGHMSEGYLGLYLTAVGLTAVGMKAMDSRDSSSRSSGSNGPTD